MKLFIPELGEKLTLSQSWEFTLYLETRNENLASYFNFRAWDITGNLCLDEADQRSRGWNKVEGSKSRFYKKITLPKDTILTIDRIYIRKGAADFSSVSFFLDKKSLDKTFSKNIESLSNAKGPIRFWAKLEDVNKIEFYDRVN